MGYTSDITNRIDGKKYLISTAQDKKGGGWQTAVFKWRLFGIPDLFHPAMFIGAPDEEHARQVHARVEEIVAELPPTEWESTKRQLFGEILDKAFPHPHLVRCDWFSQLVRPWELPLRCGKPLRLGLLRIDLPTSIDQSSHWLSTKKLLFR